MDSVQDERELHLVLADNRAERIDKPLHQAEPVLSISRWTLSTIALCDRSKRPQDRPPSRSARPQQKFRAYAPSRLVTRFRGYPGSLLKAGAQSITTPLRPSCFSGVAVRC